jgi:hypothetical protein
MIVGRYYTPDGNTHGFTLVNGQFQSIDAPGASSTDVAWVNFRGDLVGSCNCNGMSPAFVLHDGQFTIIAYPGATLTTGWAISNAGDVVGLENDGNFFASHGYLYRHGTFTSIDVPNAQAT